MTPVGLDCIRCGTRQPIRITLEGCPSCGDIRSNLRVCYADTAALRWSAVPQQDRGSMWRYAAMLPVASEDVVSLGEGGTPLLHARALGRDFGLERLYLKDESRNPTWSYKDRLSTVAVSVARRMGVKVMATASSGNAGASLAAYAARAGMPCVVFTYAGTAGPMLAQIRKYGAKVVPLLRKQDRWPMLKDCVQRFGWFATSPYSAPVIGSHPLGIEGYKSIAYEICADLGWTCPDWVVMPVCYGDALAGAWYGFQELQAAGVIRKLPRLVAVEVFGSLAAVLDGNTDQVPDMPAAFAPLAISVGATQGSYQALKALRESGGRAEVVGNAGLIAMQENLAQREGVFAELTATMPAVAIRSLAKAGVIGPKDTVVGVVTASGLKDLDKSVSDLSAEAGVPGTFEDVSRYLTQQFRFNPAQAA